jgi:hypothetical protein
MISTGFPSGMLFDDKIIEFLEQLYLVLALYIETEVIIDHCNQLLGVDFCVENLCKNDILINPLDEIGYEGRFSGTYFSGKKDEPRSFPDPIAEVMQRPFSGSCS